MAKLEQLLLAIVFLTRLPVGRFLPPKIMPLANAAWAFPLVGALIGGVAALPLVFLDQGFLGASLSVGLIVWLTGALHEDALADFADSTGGKDPQQRLEIMRDSRIGSYGTMALILSTCLRIGALMIVGPQALVVAACWGRTAILIPMRYLPHARSDGLGHAAGRPTMAALIVALVLALLMTLPLGVPGIMAPLVVALVVIAVQQMARRLLGGQTGDVLGATSLMTETAILIFLAA